MYAWSWDSPASSLHRNSGVNRPHYLVASISVVLFKIMSCYVYFYSHVYNCISYVYLYSYVFYILIYVYILIYIYILCISIILCKSVFFYVCIYIMYICIYVGIFVYIHSMYLQCPAMGDLRIKFISLFHYFIFH